MRVRRDRDGSSAWTPDMSGTPRWDLGPDVPHPVAASRAAGAPAHPLDGLWDDDPADGEAWEEADWLPDGEDIDIGETLPRRSGGRTDTVAAAPGGVTGIREGLREAMSSPAAAFTFARRHAAIVLVAFVVALGIAATHLFRAHTDAVPVNSVVATPASSSSRSPRATDPGTAGTVASGVPATGAASPAAPASSTAPANVTVQVLGPVRHPGVVTLRGGSRVKDALEACGGLLPGADAAELNLAAVLQDADQVVVGTHAHPRGEVRQGDASTGSDPTGSGGSSVPAGRSSSAASTAVVNLNTATLEQLDSIPGVGPVTAQRIVDWRSQHGRFSSTRELQEVDGIGPKSFARIAPHVTV